MPKLALHFGEELIAAGLADGVIWEMATGNVFGPDTWTDAKKKQLADLVKAHDPNRPQPYRITKLQIIDRMTDAQLDAFDADMEKVPKRMKRSWEVAQDIDSKHPLFAQLKQAMTAKWGAAEAERILARPPEIPYVVNASNVGEQHVPTPRPARRRV